MGCCSTDVGRRVVAGSSTATRGCAGCGGRCDGDAGAAHGRAGG